MRRVHAGRTSEPAVGSRWAGAGMVVVPVHSTAEQGALDASVPPWKPLACTDVDMCVFARFSSLSDLPYMVTRMYGGPKVFLSSFYDV